MISLITSYFLQSKECILPSIGIFQIKKIPATFNSDTRELLPPSEEILFSNESLTTSPGLARYIAHKQNIEQQEAEEMLETFCNEWKEKINKGEVLNFETIGKLRKDENGEIIFERADSFNYLKPITIDNPYKNVAEVAPATITSVSEGDNIVDERVEEYGSANGETILAEENAGKMRIKSARNWIYWAATLFLIGAAFVFLQFKDHKFSGLNTGNKSKFVIDSAGATYTKPK